MSFSKREQEKNRLKKRKEKQKRKEERKANSKGGSFEDMIAYVDENGQIVDTPPDPEKKEEVDLESIQISTPKKEDVEEDDLPLRGRVEYFTESKGYGFVKDLESSEKYFFHVSNAYEDIAEGAVVNYELEKGPRGMNAVRITPEKK